MTTTTTPADIMSEFNTLLQKAKAAGISCGISPMYGGRATVAIMFNGDVGLTDDMQLTWKYNEGQSRIIPQNE